MKKIIVFLIVFILCFSPVTVFAKTPLLDTSQFMMGDVNEDNKVNAADSRIVLRVASKLDASDSVAFYNADANGDEKINSSDARIILRVAANLTEFVFGFDGNGVPCAINVLKSSKYSADLTYNDIMSGEENISMTLAMSGDNVYLMSDSLGFDMSELGFSDCGVMINDNKIYALIVIEDENIAMFLPDSASAEMGMEKDEILQLTEIISVFIPDDIGTATRVVLNNENVFCYTYEISGSKYMLYVAENGSLIRIDGVIDDANKALVLFDDISVDSVDEYFDMNNYELI